MNRIITFLFSLAFFSSIYANEVSVSSPNGQLVVTISETDGHVTYAATLNGQQVLNPSALGLKTNVGEFTEQLLILNSQLSAVSSAYTMRGTKASKADYKANQLTVDLKNKHGQPISIIFQVSDNDIAFRYVLPRQKVGRREYKRALVYEELSSFNFPDATTTFISPQIGPESGWEQTKPSYEEGYSADAPMNVKSQYGHGYIFPALFHITLNPSPLTTDLWALVSETGVGSNYCGSHLSDYKPGVGYTVAYPDKGENNGVGSEFAGIPLPGETPWRTITVGSNLKPIVETTISYDLVEPLYEPSTDYKPGRYTWSWLLWQDNSINYDDQVKFIDLASTMGFEYCLVDNWWDTQIGRDRIEELSKYAQSKGVHLLLWYNSNGFWNDAPQTPRNCMNTAIAREREMKWLQSIGVKGIKVDFFGGDKQETMRLYEEILSDANRYGLQVVFHGCTIPRGWERMYPNYVASEAVLASENLHFGQGSCDAEAHNAALHAFMRNTVGSMDFGGSTLNKYYSADNKRGTHRVTSDVYALATAVLFQSPVQHFALAPNNLTDAPAWAIDFMKTVPTTWDEVKFIDGYPGKYAIIARRTGTKWFVVGINADDQPLKKTLTLPMFEKGMELQVYADDAQLNGSVSTQKAKKQFTITIPKNGGLVIKN